MLRFLAVMGTVMAISSDVQAFDIECSNFRPLLQDRQLERPKLPACTSSFYPFSDSYDFGNCKSQIENYKSQLTSYLSCLQSESKDAIAEYNNLVTAFNRRASQ